MARTLNQIYQQVVDNMVAEYAKVGVTINPALWSKYSPRRLTCFVVANCILILEQILDAGTALINTIIATRKTHTIGWYVTKAKEYQHGRSLVKDQDYYDNTGLTAEEVEEERVIKYAAAVEVYDHVNGLKGIRVKVATIVDGELAPVPGIQKSGFDTFMEIVKDAGVKLYKTTGEADHMKLEMDIYYNPLVLDADGKRLDGTNDTPVQDAINSFLLSGMDFNGRFVTSLFFDKIQQLDGVKIPHIVLIQAKYGELDWTDIPVMYQPDSGYMRIVDPEDNLTLNFIADGTV